MAESETLVDRVYTRIKANPVVSVLIILGSIVIGLSTFTDAAKNLLSLVVRDTRPHINGVWQAEVTYDWNSAKYTETFTFEGDGDAVYGTASFLGKKRGIVEGKITKDTLHFMTTTGETLGSLPTKDSIHDYRGRIVGGEMKFVMQTRGGYSEHIPIEFVAKRVGRDSSPETR